LADSAAQTLLDKFPKAVTPAPDFRGEESLVVAREGLAEVLRFVYSQPDMAYRLLEDICGVDYPAREARFEAVYHLYSLKAARHLRLKVRVGEEDPALPTATGIWKAADWFEREAFDQYGIRFEGHPNLRRILNHEDFVGHPLRKDYPIKKRQKLTRPTNLGWEEGQSRGNGGNGNGPSGGEPEWMVLNIGPAHPTMHGTLRVLARLEGETILEAAPEIGYLHRGFEKGSEHLMYQQVIPLTDRLNYVSAMMNNVGYCRAVEKLLGIEVSRRVQYIRVIVSELSRIIDHFVCIAANLVDMGALTPYWYCFRERENVYELLEALCGARLTTSYTRIGGLAHDLPAGWAERCRAYVRERIPRAIEETETLITKNRIFMDRTMGVGAISGEDALNWGFTGPCLRASGVPFDVRKANPYYDYDKFDFEIPVGSNGDTYDRYLVRMEEMRQSLRIVEQALDGLPEGPVSAQDRRISLPPKEAVYTRFGSLVRHIKLIVDGILPPEGEVYSVTEAANGVLGFYIVSDGTKNPYRIKVRPPCFAIYQAIPQLTQGNMIADLIAIIGSLNIIAGELDR
jgi:NADH-quinone oxidoreductase subunit C/D